jgi:hypothetical protein
VDPGVRRQCPDLLLGFGQGRFEQLGVVAVRAVGGDAQRDAPGLDQGRAFQALLAAIHRGPAGLVALDRRRGDPTLACRYQATVTIAAINDWL